MGKRCSFREAAVVVAVSNTLVIAVNTIQLAVVCVLSNSLNSENFMENISVHIKYSGMVAATFCISWEEDRIKRKGETKTPATAMHSVAQRQFQSNMKSRLGEFHETSSDKHKHELTRN
jgi:hypothetical protein